MTAEECRRIEDRAAAELYQKWKRQHLEITALKREVRLLRGEVDRLERRLEEEMQRPACI